MALTDYAWTDKYLTQNGSGSLSGNDPANAWDIAAFNANKAAGQRVNLSGNFTSQLQGAAGTSAGTPFMLRGWTTGFGAVCADFSDLPNFTVVTLPAISPTSYNIIRGIETTSTGGGIINLASDYVIIELCDISGATANAGISLDNYTEINQSRIHDNAVKGIIGDIGTVVNMCELYDNVGTHVELGGIGGGVVNSFLARSSANGIDLVGANGTHILFCTIDDNAIGINKSSQSTPLLVHGCQITNNTTGISNNELNAVYYSNFFGNTTDNSTVVHDRDGNTFIDPQYVDIANNDYEIQAASLKSKAIVPMLGNFSVGAWQDVNGAAGGGGYRPRIMKGA